MIIDFDTFNFDEILDMMKDKSVLDLRISEAIELLEKS
jgi:hypothetical protein